MRWNKRLLWKEDGKREKNERKRGGEEEERVGEVGQVNETCRRRQEQETGARNDGEWGSSEDKKKPVNGTQKEHPPYHERQAQRMNGLGCRLQGACLGEITSTATLLYWLP